MEGKEGKGRKFRVLIVEDEVDLLEIIGDVLREQDDFEVRTETNGYDAILTIASWKPDIVLLDFVMPKMNGFELCKLLRQNKETRDVLILAITGLTNPENRRAVYESGITDFMGKPFRGDDLIGKVRTLLELTAASEDSSPDVSIQG